MNKKKFRRDFILVAAYILTGNTKNLIYELKFFKANLQFSFAVYLFTKCVYIR